MYNEKGILWKSILEIQGIPLIVIPYRYGVLTIFNLFCYVFILYSTRI